MFTNRHFNSTTLVTLCVRFQKILQGLSRGPKILNVAIMVLQIKFSVVNEITVFVGAEFVFVHVPSLWVLSLRGAEGTSYHAGR